MDDYSAAWKILLQDRASLVRQPAGLGATEFGNLWRGLDL